MPRGGNLSRLLKGSSFTGITGTPGSYTIGGYNTDDAFADAIMREYGMIRTKQELERKAIALKGSDPAKNVMLKTVQEHYIALKNALKKHYASFKEVLESEYEAGATGQEAVDNAIRAINQMILATHKLIDRSHPIGGITAGLNKPSLSI